MQQQINKFDNLEIDVDRIYGEWPVGEVKARKGGWHGVYRNNLLPLRWRHNLWHVLRRTQLDQSWFERFVPYWSEVLGGRPLAGVQDLYFLRNWYRVKFQQSRIDDGADAGEHLRAWQSPEVIYQLLDRVYKESLVNELSLVKIMQKHIRGGARKILEFGCATAPITTSMLEFGVVEAIDKAYITDIKTVSFHYATYKLGGIKRVKPVLLEEENNFHLQLNERLDVIFCITVFEHLPDPLETVRIFHNRLRPGGLLIFDYVKGGGSGLDTSIGQEAREEVLDFIGEHFAVVHGSLSKSASMPVTVARRRC